EEQGKGGEEVDRVERSLREREEEVRKKQGRLGWERRKGRGAYEKTEAEQDLMTFLVEMGPSIDIPIHTLLQGLERRGKERYERILGKSGVEDVWESYCMEKTQRQRADVERRLDRVVGSSLGISWDEVKGALEGDRALLQSLPLAPDGSPQALEPLFHRYMSKRRAKAQEALTFMLQESKMLTYWLKEGGLDLSGIHRVLEEDARYHLMGYDPSLRDKLIREYLQGFGEQGQAVLLGKGMKRRGEGEDGIEEQDMDHGEED
ncbi:hypothetical protein BJ684DRAFT_20035, partial [Piptocephalis cylindrospora]